VYQNVPTTPENMRKCIIDNCAAAMKSQVSERSRQSFVQRMKLCIKFNDYCFEHLLLAQNTKLFIHVDI
jgi:hypothetical protein